MISFRRIAVLAAAFAAIGTGTAALAQEKVLRVVPHSNLAILDPIWTTAYMSRNHGYMIYDTLFGTDAKARIKPQMVDTWKMSKDGKTWTFRLRKGLAFHDGAPVTSEDVVASLKRWGARDTMGQQLMSFVEAMETPAADTFVLKLREPCGFVLEALGKPSSNVPFIMPKRVAETDPFKQIDDYTGSGPYIFKKDEFKPGDKAVYVKNTKYVPRKEPASGTAGGKRVYVDRVEFNLALRDPQAQVNALAKGEVDILERPAFESYAQLEQTKGVEIFNRDPMGFQYMCRFNSLYPPFDNAKVRRAALAAFRQEAFLQAQVGIKKYYHGCPSMFTCNTPYASTAGSEIMAKSNMRKARELLKESGYDGTPVVLMKPTDLAAIQKLPDVAAQLMRQAGFKVDLQAMDWQTLVSRRAKKDPPSQGGWNMFCTAWVAPDIWSPLNNAALDTKGRKASWFGWPDDPKIEELKAQFARELNLEKRKKLAAAIQAEAFAYGTHAPLGEYINPVALRKGITGLVIGPGDFYWNVKKD
jgi:peptide/nickel transport system substrate-binding protein